MDYQDIVNHLNFAGADGVMSAEGILDNPALFLPRYGSRSEDRDKPITVWTLPKSNNNVEPSEQVLKEKKKRKLLKKLREIEIIEQKNRDDWTPKEQKKVVTKQKRQEKLNKLLQAEKGTTTNASSNARMEQVTVTLGSLYEAADDKLLLANEYLDLATAFPVQMRSVIFHIRRMLKDLLTQYQLLDECLSCESIPQVRAILQKLQDYRINPQSFVYDNIKAKAEKEALERKRREEGKRQAYEARMIRKAKREGKTDLHYYLKIGAELPSQQKLQEFKAMKNRQDVLALWKQNHSQHCMSFHLDDSGCQRGRACAFLHVEVVSNNKKHVFVEQDEVAG